MKIHILVAATFYFQVPSYISRSVAGSYDNEAVAIFALIFTFYLYIKVSPCYIGRIKIFQEQGHASFYCAQIRY